MVKRYLVMHEGDLQWKVRGCLFKGFDGRTGLPLVLSAGFDRFRVVGAEFLFEDEALAKEEAARRNEPPS